MVAEKNNGIGWASGNEEQWEIGCEMERELLLLGTEKERRRRMEEI
jgi:hypothetical protein